MNPTLTKAARALLDERVHGQSQWDKASPLIREDAMREVIAVLKAIREPSDEMIRTVRRAFMSYDDRFSDPDDCAKRIIEDLMDTILTNQTTNPTGSGE